MKKLYRFRYEIGAGLSALALGAALFYGIYLRPTAPFPRFAVIVVTFVSALLLFRFLRALWREKWQEVASKGLQKLVEKVSNLFWKVFERWIPTTGRKNVLGGTSTITFDFSSLTQREKKPKKSPKWKQMRTEREKLGFLYRHMIHQKQRCGLLAHPWDTPLELQQKEENQPHEDSLFSLYLQTRYDESATPNPDQIQSLKSDFGVK